MTEDEARKKWCCMALQSAITTPTAANRDVDGSPISSCIASDCMMWRQHNPTLHIPRHDSLEEIKDHAKEAISQMGTGYCGLAK